MLDKEVIIDLRLTYGRRAMFHVTWFLSLLFLKVVSLDI